MFFDSPQDAELLTRYLDARRDDFARFIAADADWQFDESYGIADTIIDAVREAGEVEEDDG